MVRITMALRDASNARRVSMAPRGRIGGASGSTVVSGVSRHTHGPRSRPSTRPPASCSPTDRPPPRSAHGSPHGPPAPARRPARRRPCRPPPRWPGVRDQRRRSSSAHASRAAGSCAGQGRAPDPLDAWLPVTALVLAALVAVRADPFLALLDAVGAAAFTGASIVAFSGLAVTRRSASVVVAMGAWVVGSAGVGAARVVPHARRAPDAEPRRVPGWLAPLGRGLFLRDPARDDLRGAVRVGGSDLRPWRGGAPRDPHRPWGSARPPALRGRRHVADRRPALGRRGGIPPLETASLGAAAWTPPIASDRALGRRGGRRPRRCRERRRACSSASRWRTCSVASTRWLPPG